MQAYTVYKQFQTSWHSKANLKEFLKGSQNENRNFLQLTPEISNALGKIGFGDAVYLYGGRDAILKAFGCPKDNRGNYIPKPPSSYPLFGLEPERTGGIDPGRLFVVRGDVEAGLKKKRLVIITAKKKSEVANDHRRQYVIGGGTDDGIYTRLSIEDLLRYIDAIQ